MKDLCIFVDADKCTGCRVCELVCSMNKYGEFNPQKSHIKVLSNEELHINIPTIDMGCDFCGKCVQWCFDEVITIIKPKRAALLRKEVKIGRFPAPLVKRGVNFQSSTE